MHRVPSPADEAPLFTELTPEQQAAKIQEYHANQQRHLEKLNFCISQTGLAQIASYKKSLTDARVEPGKNLSRVISEAYHAHLAGLEADSAEEISVGEFLAQLTLEEFIDLMIRTRPPKSFGEQADDAAAWSLRERGLMANISLAVSPVRIYADGYRTSDVANAFPAKHVHPESFDAHLIILSAPILEEHSPDYYRVVKDDELYQPGFNELYEQRLLPLLLHANELGKNQGKRVVVNLPGLGCGLFAGKWQGNPALKECLKTALQYILESHHEKLQHLAMVRLDPYMGLEKSEDKYGEMIFRVGCSRVDGKQQLSTAKNLQEEGDDFSDCIMVYAIAGDAFSFPSNDLFVNSPEGDEATKAYCSNLAEIVSGIFGEFDPNNNRFMPIDFDKRSCFEDENAPGGGDYGQWIKAVSCVKPQLIAKGRIKIATAEGELVQLNGNTFGDINAMELDAKALSDDDQQRTLMGEAMRQRRLLDERIVSVLKQFQQQPPPKEQAAESGFMQAIDQFVAKQPGDITNAQRDGFVATMIDNFKALGIKAKIRAFSYFMQNFKKDDDDTFGIHGRFHRTRCKQDKLRNDLHLLLFGMLDVTSLCALGFSTEYSAMLKDWVLATHFRPVAEGALGSRSMKGDREDIAERVVEAKKISFSVEGEHTSLLQNEDFMTTAVVIVNDIFSKSTDLTSDLFIKFIVSYINSEPRLVDAPLLQAYVYYAFSHMMEHLSETFKIDMNMLAEIQTNMQLAILGNSNFRRMQLLPAMAMKHQEILHGGVLNNHCREYQKRQPDNAQLAELSHGIQALINAKLLRPYPLRLGQVKSTSPRAVLFGCRQNDEQCEVTAKFRPLLQCYISNRGAWSDFSGGLLSLFENMTAKLVDLLQYIECFSLFIRRRGELRFNKHNLDELQTRFQGQLLTHLQSALKTPEGKLLYITHSKNFKSLLTVHGSSLVLASQVAEVNAQAEDVWFNTDIPAIAEVCVKPREDMAAASEEEVAMVAVGTAAGMSCTSQGDGQ